MIKYFLKRVIFAFISLFIIVTVVYFLTSLLPYLPQGFNKNIHETDQEYYQRLAQIGLGPYGKSVVQRWWEYISGIFHGDFGMYFANQTNNIPELFFNRVPFTFLISFIALIISIILGLVFGTICAFYRGSWIDILLNVLSTIFISIPSFIFALMLIKIGGATGIPIIFIQPGNNDYTLEGMLKSMILPVLSLSFGVAAFLTYFIRNELVEVMNQDYIKTAKSKGQSTFKILIKHMYRNVGIPLVSAIAPQFIGILSGSLIIERFFGVTGPANLLVSGLLNGEINLVLFNIVFFGLIYFILDILMDCCYPLIDPRVVLVEKNNFSYLNRTINWLGRWNWVNNWRKILNKNSIWIENNSQFFNYLKNNNRFDFKKKAVTLNLQELLNMKVLKDANDFDNKRFLVIQSSWYKIVINDLEGGKTNG
ncbi:MAG: ABC transporter permease [Malacoplasma sp.]|nr:ABC transporter permease [Malacoplasma sp.]MDE6562893.1 ABC transporter permease [Malacoplasma sp.]